VSSHYVNGLSEHPFITRDDNDRRVEHLSWHEAVCDLARAVYHNPKLYSDIHPEVADYLETINIQVNSLSVYIKAH